MLGTIVSTQRCKACDCRNEIREPLQSGTGSGLSAKHWPCVGDEIAPCSYFVLFECTHPWPVTGVESFKPPLTHYATELKKQCLTTGRYSWWSEGADAEGYPVDKDGIELVATHPPSRLNGDLVKPRWSSIENFCLTGGYLDEEDAESVNVLWKLVDVRLDPVQLVWDYEIALTALGKSAPVYESVTAWNLWGRNTMRLTDASRLEWPSLKPEVCVVPSDVRRLFNYCDDAISRCRCRDLGGESPTLNVTLACSNFPGTRVLVYERFRSAVGLACGINFPDTAPCGLFVPTTVLGGQEPSCFPRKPGATLEIDSTEFMLTLWCDGENYHIEAYCKFYGTGTGTPCWESQGECIVTQLPKCRSMALMYETPPLDCCCSETGTGTGEPPIETECCDAVSATLTVQVTNHGVMREFTITYDAGLGQWQGAEGAWLAPGLGAILKKTDSHPFIDACFFTLTCYTQSLNIRTETIGYYWATEDPAKTDLMTGYGSYLKAATCDPFYLKFEQTAATLFPFNGDCDDTANYESIDLLIEIME